MEYIQDIDKNSLLYYQGIISPKLQSLEKKRKHQLKTLWYLKLCLAICWFWLIVIGINHLGDEDTTKFIAVYSAVLFAFIYFSVQYFMFKDYPQKTKKKIMHAILNSFGNFEWSEDLLTDLSDLAQSGLVNNYGLGSVMANFEGIYKDVRVSIFQIELNYLIPSANAKEKCCGIFCTFNLPRNLNGHSVIVEGLRTPIPNLKPVTLEDEEFDRMFRVYSSEAGEAKYLLTKDFTETFKKLRQDFKTNVGAAFFENKVFFAVFSQDDYFMLNGLKNSLLDAKQLKKFIKGLWTILALVDMLKTNKDLGL